MSLIDNWLKAIRTRTVAFVAIVLAVAVTAISCSSSPSASTADTVAGIAPEIVVDYIHTVAASDRTAYTKHVVARLKKLEGNEKPNGVVPAEATEAWQQVGGIPLPAQMFRLGAELASEDGDFTIGLISPWNINDNQAPKGEFEEVGMQKVIETGEPYKGYQEIGGQKYYSAIYPDPAVAEACASCHNNHPVHKERYPDKVFKLDDVMGGVVINLPLSGT